MNRIGDRAVVLGASMSGLLAARVLADFYDTVTVVERDALPADAEHRRGVPQSRHIHALLPRGAQVMGEFFPGLLDRLVADGVPKIVDDASQIYFAPGGHPIVRSGYGPDGRAMYVPSRPILEGHVRQSVRSIPNVTILDGTGVADLTTTGDRRRVTGVRVGSGDAFRTLTGDLVVDAMGRGARTPAFLDKLGYGRPVEEHIVVHVTYRSHLLRIPPGTVREKVVLIGARPGRPTSMALFGYENDTWMFTAIGVAGREPPHDLAGMTEFVEPFTPAHVLAAIRSAEPLGAVAQYRFPSSQWRHYERMRRFPDGFLAVGDAICSFNPVYGQGMTVAALEAEALRKCLRSGDSGLARRFFHAAAKPVGVAWQLAAGGDLALPEIEGPRPLRVRVGNAYVDRILTTAETDPAVAARFLRVSSLLDPPRNLAHPALVARVCAANIRRRRRSASAAERSGASTAPAP